MSALPPKADIAERNSNVCFGPEPESITVPYPLIRANDALADLRNGRLQGAVVSVP
jgi:hypothetical protein